MLLLLTPDAARRGQLPAVQKISQYRTGEAVYENGARFKGDFVGGKREGWGLLLFSNGDRYEGEWHHDCMHGDAATCSATQDCAQALLRLSYRSNCCCGCNAFC